MTVIDCCALGRAKVRWNSHTKAKAGVAVIFDVGMLEGISPRDPEGNLITAAVCGAIQLTALRGTTVPPFEECLVAGWQHMTAYEEGRWPLGTSN